MKQIKTIRANYSDDFDREVNSFLASIEDDEPKIEFSPNISEVLICHITYVKTKEDIVDEKHK